MSFLCFCILCLNLLSSCQAQFEASQENKLVREIAEFVHCNTAKLVNVKQFPPHQLQKFPNLILKEMMTKPIAYVSSNNEKKMLRNGEFHLIFTGNSDQLQSALTYISDKAHNFTQKSFLLIHPFEALQDSDEKIKALLSTSNKNALFYITQLTNGKWNWKQILTVKGQSQVIINTLYFGMCVHRF